MRECWINVYPGIDVDGGHFLGWPSLTRLEASHNAIGYGPAIEAEPAFVGRCLRKAGVGYRLHVRLKPGVHQFEGGWKHTGPANLWRGLVAS